MPPRRVKILGVALAEADEDVVANVVGRDDHELRLLGEIAAAREWIAGERPDVLILDEDAADDAMRALLDALADELRAPVVVLLSSEVIRPSLATAFGVPSLRKPVSAESLAAAVEVALEKRLSPLRRSGASGG